jgi:hypothetical protein
MNIHAYFQFISVLNLQNRLQSCEISGSHGGECEDDSFLGYSAM